MKDSLTGTTLTHTIDLTMLSPAARKEFTRKHFGNWYHALVYLYGKYGDKAHPIINDIIAQLKLEWPNGVNIVTPAEITEDIQPRYVGAVFWKYLRPAKAEGKKKAPAAASKAEPKAEPKPAAPTVSIDDIRPYISTYLMHIPADATKIPSLDVVTYPQVFQVMEKAFPDAVWASYYHNTSSMMIFSTKAVEGVLNTRATSLFDAPIGGEVYIFCGSEAPKSVLKRGSLSGKWGRLLKNFEYAPTHRSGLKVAKPKAVTAKPLQ